METTKTIIKNAIKYLNTPGHMQTFINQLTDADWYKVITDDSTGNDVFNCAIDHIIYIFAVDYKNKEVHFLDEPLDSNNIQKIKGFVWDMIPSESVSNSYVFREPDYKPDYKPEYTCSISMKDIYNNQPRYSGSVSTLDTVTVTYCNIIDEMKAFKNKYESTSSDSDNNLILNNKNVINKMCIQNSVDLFPLSIQQKYVLDCLKDNKNVIIAKGRQIGITNLLLNYAIFSKYKSVHIIASNMDRYETIYDSIRKILSYNKLLHKYTTHPKVGVFVSLNKMIKISALSNCKDIDYNDTLCIFDEVPYYNTLSMEDLSDVLIKTKQTVIVGTPSVDSSFNDIYKNRFDMFKINLPKNGVTVNDITSLSPNIISNEFNAIVQ